MNMTRLFTLVLAAASLLACMPLASASGAQGSPIAPSPGDHPITIDQAKESIRAFMDDKTLEPVYLGAGKNEMVGWHYLLEVKNSTFGVNADTGSVEAVQFRDNMPASSPEIKITRDAAYAKAVEFAGQKSDGFSKKTWALVVDRMAGPADGVRGYAFAFREKVHSGTGMVLLPNIVLVSVNPETGAVISYVALNRVPIDGSAMTPEQQAFIDYIDHIDEQITGP